MPARAPEWNPIELLWNYLEEHLKIFDLEQITQKQDRVVVATFRILVAVTHATIKKFYRKSGVFGLHGFAEFLFGN